MTNPLSRFFSTPGVPRLHLLEWNPQAATTLILLHGGSANAWWWEPLAAAVDGRYRLIALDQRGHGDSEWIRPAAYGPDDYTADLQAFLTATGCRHPIVVGHSMGGINTLAFAARFPGLLRAAVAIDVAVTSSEGRDRYLRRLKGLPIVAYPDLETARARFRLMPREGDVHPEILGAVAQRSLMRLEDGRYTLKFDRESFFGSDGLDVRKVIANVPLPVLLVRGGLSRIMTAEAALAAERSNPRVRLVTIPNAHHHLPLETPHALLDAIDNFILTLG